MAAQRGLEMLLKVDSDGTGTYVTMAGIRTASVTFDSQTVDITSQDDTSRWRQLLANAGVKSFAATGEGVFKDAAADAVVKNYIVNGTIRNWQIIIPSFQTITGPMQITSHETAGAHDGEVTYNLSLESAGDPTITAL